MLKHEIKNFVWYLFPFLFKNIVPLLLLPIITRSISVEDFGVYALAVTYSIFCTGLVNLGLLAVFERNFFELSSYKRESVLFTIFLFVIINFLTVAILTWFFSDNIAIKIFQEEQIKNFLLITLTFQTFKSFNQYFLIFYKNYEEPKKYSYLSIIESLLSNGLGLFFLIYYSMGLKGFILGQTIGVLIVFLTTFFIYFFPFNYRLELKMLKSHLNLSIPLTPRIFFGVINTQFDRYMLSLLGTISAVGLYDIGQKIANTTFTFMTALQNVFSPQVYKRLFSEDPDYNESIGSYLTPFFYISILVCLIVGVFSYEILFIITPIDYHSAAPVISILCLLYGFYFFGKQPQLLFAKKTTYISILSFLSLGLNIGLNIPMIYYYGLYGAAFATTIAGIISTIISFYLGQKFTPINYEKKVFLMLLYFIFSIFSILYFIKIDFYYPYQLSFKLILLLIFMLIGWKLKILRNKTYISLYSKTS